MPTAQRPSERRFAWADHPPRRPDQSLRRPYRRLVYAVAWVFDVAVIAAILWMSYNIVSR